MFLLRFTDAVSSKDERGPFTSLLAEAVRPKVRSTPDVVEYEPVYWLGLHETYIPSGPLDLTPYPLHGSEVALSVSDYGIWGSFRSPALFELRVREASFDSSLFLGKVYVAEGRDGVRLYEPFRPVRWIPEHAYRASLAQLGLSAALIVCLESEGILTAADICVRTTEELLEIRNVGDQQLQELRDRLAKAGLRPWEEPSGQRRRTE